MTDIHAVDLVTLEEAKKHLAMDHDEDDELIAIYVSAASNAVLNYITARVDQEPDSSSSVDWPIPPVVKAATLLLIGDFYKNRESKTDDPVIGVDYGFGHLPRTVIALLYAYRTPILR
jgi:uncharacterized phage protein (predicted DNA packaging)